MRNIGPQLFFFLLVLAAAITIACGSSQPRVLESVDLSPEEAIFNGSPVQFTATATYNRSPTSVTPFNVTWGACTDAGNPTIDVTVSSTGLASCASGASGTFIVWGYGTSINGATCDVVTACGGGCGRVTGIAALTCP
jgi:hypothetical protein